MCDSSIVRQAVFLVGGLGTRLGQLVTQCPKPMLPVCGRPFLERMIHMVAAQKFTQIVLLAGYKAEIIRSHFSLSGEARLPDGVSLQIVEESFPMGTGGALHYALQHTNLLKEKFLLLNGDTVTGVPLRKFANLPFNDNEVGRMAALEIPLNNRYGEIEFDGDIPVCFKERPEIAGPGVINAGIYLLRRDPIKKFLGRHSVPCSLEKDIFPKLVAERKMRASRYQSYFIDIGTPEDFKRAQTELIHMFDDIM